MQMKQFIPIIFVFFSCSREVPIDVMLIEQVMVVSAIIDTKGQDSLILTRTYNKPELNDDLSAVGIKDATVYVLSEGEKVGQFLAKSKGVYSFEGERFVNGKEYSLEIIHSDFHDVSAKTQIPETPLLWNETYPPNGENVQVDNSPSGIDFQVLIAFTDNVQTNDYYMLSASSYSEFVYEHNSPIIRNEPARLNSKSPFVELVRSRNTIKMVQNTIDWEGGYSPFMNEIIFGDKLFNGKTITVPIDLSLSTMLQDTKKVFIILTTISEDYYQLLRSLAALTKNADGFFPESLDVFSNINNGQGVWAAKSSKTIAIQVDGQRIYNEKYN